MTPMTLMTLVSVDKAGLEPASSCVSDRRLHQIQLLILSLNKRTKPGGVRNGREAAWPESNRQHPDFSQELYH